MKGGKLDWVALLVNDPYGLDTDVCDIYRNATVSADIGHFEQYRNSAYLTWPDHIRL